MIRASLFDPIRIGSLPLRNRIVVAPMCQYTAEQGRMTDWHTIHLGDLALSGAGMLVVEASAVLPEGRISYGDVGLWDDATEAAMARVLDAVRRYSDIPVAIQLAHAGRKASCAKPWDGGAQLPPDHALGWQTVAPSAIPFAETDHSPVALDHDGMARIRDAFGEAARRAARLGYDAVQVHSATVICCTSSFPRSPTGGRMITAAASKTACVSRSKCSMRCAARSRRKSR